MTHPTDIDTLVRWMAADFSNQAQAFENPPFFAHIHVAMRPLPVELLGTPSLWLEQAYHLDLTQPYRVRVLKPTIVENRIEIENYKVDGEEDFYNAVREPQRLATLTADRLQFMSCCNAIVTWTGQSFYGEIEPGKACLVERKGKLSYLDNTFEVSEDSFWSLDRGRDLETDELLWGSIAGAFEFQRIASFAPDLPNFWV
jgi:hypothetical protein